MLKIITFNSINKAQKGQYKDAITKAFPPIIGESPIIKKYWSRLEEYFPEYQFLLISGNGALIGFMNTVPFEFDRGLNHLPDRGWDWMLSKGVADFENKVPPNYLGGLQVIVRSEFQGLGFSKRILSDVKDFVAVSNFSNLVIPIRPTKKHEFPTMPMVEYMNRKEESDIYDPWIRTHLNSGAQVIKICERSMMMYGDIDFWEGMLKRKLEKSGRYQLDGALSLITIDVENDRGEYVEPNIWIKY